MSLTKTTPSIRAQDIDHQWFIVDLEDQVLGRAAVQIANVLRGRNKPTWTPHTDTGDHVVVLNAAKVRLTGRKLDQKIYRHHTQFIGGLKEAPARRYLQRHSEEAIRRAVWGMMPKGPLGRQVMRKLKIYAGTDHPHQAQKPNELKL